MTFKNIVCCMTQNIIVFYLIKYMKIYIMKIKIICSYF